MSINAAYWPIGGAQKMRFILGSNTHICAHNPTQYPMSPLTKAQAATMVQMGPNQLSGGVEFPPSQIQLEWAEMSLLEYTQLGAFNLIYCTMIDMYDYGYQGWLILNSYTPNAGVAQMVGQVVATFVVSKPANGLISTINTLSPGTLSHSVTTGGSIPASTTLYYGLTFFSLWGESTLSTVVSVSTGGTADAMINLSWTGPSSGFYRKARLYIASSTFSGGSTGIYVKAEVYASFTQSWADYCGLNGVTATTTTPSSNNSFTGMYAGGVWQNMT